VAGGGGWGGRYNSGYGRPDGDRDQVVCFRAWKDGAIQSSLRIDAGSRTWLLQKGYWSAKQATNRGGEKVGGGILCGGWKELSKSVGNTQIARRLQNSLVKKKGMKKGQTREMEF